MTTKIEAPALLIEGGRVMLPDGDQHRPERVDLLVEDGMIAAIGSDLSAEAAQRPDCRRIDATDRLVIPGFINAHYHSHDVLAKGLMEEEPLETWRLLALPPQYPKRSREEIKVRTLLGALECLKSGMTTVQDMVTLFPFDPDHLSAVVEAYEELGLRAVIALQYADRKGIGTIPHWPEVFPPEYHDKLSTAAEPDAKIDQIAHFEEAYLKGPKHPTIGWALGPSAPERCTHELLQRTREMSEKYDLQIFTHFYESKGMALQARVACPEHGGSLVRALHYEGLLSPRLNLAHSVWLLDDEIDLLAETGTRCVLNPLSNLKLKSGVPPVRRLQEAGVGYGLGCDNCSCSDAQNMFEAMKFAAMVTAIADHEPGPPQAAKMFEAATSGGAACIGRSDDLGAIEVGRRADIVLLDLIDPSFLPLNSAVRQLVYTEAGRGVRMVIVEGRVVIEDGRSTLLDEAELARCVEEVMPRFSRDFAEIRARVDGLKPYLEEAHRRIWADDVGIDRLFHEHGREPAGT